MESFISVLKYVVITIVIIASIILLRNANFRQFISRNRQVVLAIVGLVFSLLAIYAIFSNPITVGLTDIEKWHNSYVVDAKNRNIHHDTILANSADGKYDKQDTTLVVSNPSPFNKQVEYKGISAWGFVGFILFALLASFCASRLYSHVRQHSAQITWQQYGIDFRDMWTAISHLRVRRYTRYYLAGIGVLIFVFFFFADLTFGALLFAILVLIVPFFGTETTDQVYYINLWICICLIVLSGIVVEGFRRYNPTLYSSLESWHSSNNVRLAAAINRPAELEATALGATQDKEDKLTMGARQSRKKGDLNAVRKMLKNGQNEIDSTSRLMFRQPVYEPKRNQQVKKQLQSVNGFVFQAMFNLQPGETSQRFDIPFGYNWDINLIGSNSSDYILYYNNTDSLVHIAGTVENLPAGKIKFFKIKARNTPISFNFKIWPIGQSKPV